MTIRICRGSFSLNNLLGVVRTQSWSAFRTVGGFSRSMRKAAQPRCFWPVSGPFGVGVGVRVRVRVLVGSTPVP